MPNRGDGLRATERTAHQSVDRTRNRRRSDATWNCADDLAAACWPSLKKRDLQPHLIRYWLTPPQDPQRDDTIVAICQVYHEAPVLAEQGERIMSTDELTGVQALERKHPGLRASLRGKSSGANLNTFVMAHAPSLSVGMW